MSENMNPDKKKKIDKVFTKYEQKTRRGFLRLIILRLFYEQFNNMEFIGYHGWGLIQKIDEITHGAWKPSPGSIYPLLKEFSASENDLIEATSTDNSEENNEKITYRITDIGIEVFRRLERLSPLVRPGQDFSSQIPREGLKKGFRAHHSHRSVSELKNMKERFEIFNEVLSEMISEKENGSREEEKK